MPYKSLNFIHQYLRIHSSLRKSERVKYFQPVLLNILLKCAHHMALTLFPPQLTATQLLLGDIVQLSCLPIISNLLIVGNILLSGYFIALSYLMEGTSTYVVTIITDFFVREETTLLIRKHTKEGGGSVTVFAYIQRRCQTVLTLLQAFILAIDGVIVVTQAVGVWMLLTALPGSTLPEKVAIFVLGEVNMATFYAGLFTFSYAHMFQGTIAFVFFEAVRLLLGQLQQLLSVKQQQQWKMGGRGKRTKGRGGGGGVYERAKFATYRQAVYRREYTRAVVTISRGNGYLGLAFVPLLLVNFPANALLTVMLIIWKKMSPAAQFIIMILCLQQFICIFIIHSFIAYLNKRLSTLAKGFTSFIYHDNQKYLVGWRQKLHSCLFFESFYTDKPYGFTYHKFGLITSFNFVKYLLLYAEMLIIIYKNFKIY